jgi:hypothetical protein
MHSSDKTWPKCILVLMGILAMFAVAGCSASSAAPTVMNEWRNPQYSAAYFKRIIVAGPAGEAILRRNIEDELGTRLRASGVEVLPSYEVIADDQNVDENRLKQAAQNAGADALIFTRAIRVEAKIESRNFAPWTAIGVAGSNVGVGMSGYPALSSPSRYYEYTSETTLYDVPKNEIVWSGTIKTVESENARTAIRAFADTVAKTLDEKNLVRLRQ